MMHMDHPSDNTEHSSAEPSAKSQLEGRLGEIDKLVMMMALMKSLITPQPSPGPAAGSIPPPLPGAGVGPPTLGGPPPMGPPMGMGMGGGVGISPGGPMTGPSQALQQALMASKGLV